MYGGLRNKKKKGREGKPGEARAALRRSESDGVNSSPTKGTPGNSAVNQEDNLNDENDRLKNKGTSYANLFTGGPSRKAMNFCTLFTLGGNGVDVVVLVESIRPISERFANTTYGFFLEKHVAYPIVANYVRNTWGKYGQVKSMLNSSTGIFSFQFSSMEGLDAMLEKGPSFIHNNPLILKKLNLNVNLLKEDVGNVSVWVKLHGVPMTAFSEDGLSAIATKLGIPWMLDSYNVTLPNWVAIE
nr:hypothetical protein [Tanacetum cinerariifolium]